MTTRPRLAMTGMCFGDTVACSYKSLTLCLAAEDQLAAPVATVGHSLCHTRPISSMCSACKNGSSVQHDIYCSSTTRVADTLSVEAAVTVLVCRAISTMWASVACLRVSSLRYMASSSSARGRNALIEQLPRSNNGQLSQSSRLLLALPLVCGRQYRVEPLLVLAVQ